MDRGRKAAGSRRTGIEKRRRRLFRNQCVLPTPYSCFVCDCGLTRWQQKKIQKIASSPSGSIEDEGYSTAHSPSPPRFTAKQKGKGRSARNPLPTPTDTQRHPDDSHSHQPQQSTSQHKGRPGPNVFTQRPGHQSESMLQVLDQRHTRRQNDGQSGTRQQKRTTEKKWTRAAKFYGIYCCPWVTELRLARVLQYEGQEFPDGDPDQGFMEFLDELNISNQTCKDPRFHANVSVPKYWL